MSSQDEAGPAPSAARAWLLYTALRLVVFIGTAGALALVGFTGFVLVLTAVLVSSLVSLFVLRPQRTALVAAQLARREQRAADRASARARLEDA